MANSSVLSVRINAEDEQALQKLAEATGESKSRLAAQAIRTFVEMNEWQIALIKERLDAADRREYASAEQVKAMFAKWGVNAD